MKLNELNKYDPLNIVERAVLENTRKDFDHTWCIFDLDTINTSPERYQKALSIARKNDFFLAESLPCFELWYLLHFGFTTKPFNECTALVKDLCKHVHGYCKEQQYLERKNMYLLLKDKTPEAVRNCIQLENFNRQNHKETTKCDVYKIIKEIDKIAIRES